MKNLVFYFICYSKHALSYQNIKILNYSIKLYGEKTKTKVLNIDEFYNFDVDDFSIWNNLPS